MSDCEKKFFVESGFICNEYFLLWLNGLVCEDMIDLVLIIFVGKMIDLVNVNIKEIKWFKIKYNNL